MKKLRILIDMDEITVDLIGAWIAAYNQQWGDTLRREDVIGWDIHEFCKKECGKKMYEILHRPGFFDHLPAIPGAVPSIRALHQAGHEILFATSTPAADAARGKVEWVKRHFEPLQYGIAKIIQIADKSLIDADVLIDDKPDTILQWARLGRPIITIVQPYNIDAATQATYAAHDWRDTRKAWAEIVNFIHAELA